MPFPTPTSFQAPTPSNATSANNTSTSLQSSGGGSIIIGVIVTVVVLLLLILIVVGFILLWKYRERIFMKKQAANANEVSLQPQTNYVDIGGKTPPAFATRQANGAPNSTFMTTSISRSIGSNTLIPSSSNAFALPQYGKISDVIMQKDDKNYAPTELVLQSEELVPFLIPFSQLSLGKRLGMGSFGVVHKAKFKGIDVACKMLSKDAKSEMKEFIDEVSFRKQEQNYKQQIIVFNLNDWRKQKKNKGKNHGKHSFSSKCGHFDGIL